MIKGIVLTVFLGVIGVSSAAQSTWNESTEVEERPLFTERFTKQEFAERRAKVYEAIGNQGVALIHVGPDAFMNHYHNSERPARPGDMILMDYGPVYEYYTSDMARMWPVNGIFNPVQRELYTFYLELYEAILTNIEIGLTPQQVYHSFVRVHP